MLNGIAVAEVRIKNKFISEIPVIKHGNVLCNIHLLTFHKVSFTLK
jgi:hypothetical protein